MHLSRVQVPDFRVLKAIDLTFEPDYMPRIFPLGSLNGGGKSTLLQLIFTLLHCTGDRSKHSFIQNLLSGYVPQAGAEPRTLAEFSLERDGQTYDLKFVVYPASAKPRLDKRLDKNSSDQTIDDSLNERHLYPVTNYRVRAFRGEEETIATGEAEQDTGSLLVSISGLGAGETEQFLGEISPYFFLAAPSTQVFLFSPPESRRKLLKDLLHSEYEEDLFQIEKDLDHFFPYRFLSVNLLITLFKLAQDQDFHLNQIVGSPVETLAPNHVQQLLTELNTILGKGILVKPNADLSEAIFELQENDRFIQLQPEDLSHGELKRLSIFMWLKYYRMNNAIVLMDEPEIAFHPDWQYQIVQDLLTWAPNNQYILATHSYEVCQALTPGHVKELEICPFLGA